MMLHRSFFLVLSSSSASKLPPFISRYAHRACALFGKLLTADFGVPWRPQHTLGVGHRFLTFLDLVLSMGELDGIDVRGPLHRDLPEWDVPPLHWRIWLGIFQAIYIVVASIVLMNLLIAMMSNTFGRIVKQSSAEWRLLFAELVKEYTETPLLPPPFSPIQYMISAIVRCALRSGPCVDTVGNTESESGAELGVRSNSSAPSLSSHGRMLRGALDQASATGRAFAWGRHLSPSKAFVLRFLLDVAACEQRQQQSAAVHRTTGAARTQASVERAFA
jgi:hypothetical protein